MCGEAPSKPKLRSRRFYPTRRRVSVTVVVVGLLAGSLFGFSPLISPISQAFPTTNPYKQSAGAFLFAETLFFFGINIAKQNSTG